MLSIFYAMMEIYPYNGSTFIYGVQNYSFLSSKYYEIMSILILHGADCTLRSITYSLYDPDISYSVNTHFSLCGCAPLHYVKTLLRYVNADVLGLLTTCMLKVINIKEIRIIESTFYF